MFDYIPILRKADLARPDGLLQAGGGADIVQFLQTKHNRSELSLSAFTVSTYWSEARKISVSEVMISRFTLAGGN